MGKRKGDLIIIGGAEDKCGRNVFWKKCWRPWGQDARIGILPLPAKSAEAGKSTGRSFPARSSQCDILDLKTRDDANSQEYADRIRDSTGFFFTGGDQLRITSILGGSRAYRELYYSYRQGTAVAGTSAGASAMSGTMIVEGNSNDAARKCTLKMAPGLNFLEGVIIDQHFDQRGRLGRLLCGVAENPGILGIGIDEDTAIRVFPEEYFEVLGSNAVTLIDGSNIKSSNVSETNPNEILAISSAEIHVLSKGYGFDLKRREVLRLH